MSTFSRSLNADLHDALETFMQDRNAAVEAEGLSQQPTHVGNHLRELVHRHSNAEIPIPAEVDIELQPTQVFELLDEFARCVVLAAEGLAAEGVQERVGQFHWRLALKDHDQVQKIQIELARRLLPDLDVGARRCAELAERVLHASPPASVKKYLRRLSRCYIAGFDAEAIMICRAVLENTVSETCARHSVHEDLTMRQKLRMARSRRWISASDEEDALTVWMRGNKAIHDDPDVVRDVLGTITLTLRVANALLGSPDDSAVQSGT